MGLLGQAFVLTDPLFGVTTDDGLIMVQAAQLNLGTSTGALDGFPEACMDFDGQLLAALTPTAVAMLPLKVEAALLQEPAFASVVMGTPVQTQTPGYGVSVALPITVIGQSGDAVGFTVASDAPTL